MNAPAQTREERSRAGFLGLIVCLLLGITLIAGNARAATTTGRDECFTELLQQYVVVGPDGINRVDYGRWKADERDHSRLKRYIVDLESRVPSRMERFEAFAFWSNLYNAITLDVVLDRYPITSIREISSTGFFDPKAYGGPWRTKRVNVEGKPYSLDDIEHQVLRPTFKDPRVHYAVNCASLGCPNLQLKAWSAKSLDADLDAAAGEFINHPRAVTVLPADDAAISAVFKWLKGPSKGSRLKVSSLFRWFNEDFNGTDAGIIAHLRKYARPDLLAALAPGATISEDDYNWSLNDAPSTKQ